MHATELAKESAFAGRSVAKAERSVMMKDFALLILPATLLDGSQFNRVALLSDIPTDEFALPKPRTLRDPGSGESFQVSYERPILEFISRAGPHEGEHEENLRD